MVVFSTFNQQTLVSKGQHRDINQNLTRKIVSIDIMRYMSIDRAHVDTKMWLIVDILQKSSRIWQATCFFPSWRGLCNSPNLMVSTSLQNTLQAMFFLLERTCQNGAPKSLCGHHKIVGRSPENSSINGVSSLMFACQSKGQCLSVR